MRKMSQIAACFFTRNKLGWILATVNLVVLYFFFWYLEGGLHNPTATGCVEGKFTLISTFRYYRGEIIGALSDIAGNFIMMLNLPASSLSNLVSDFLFSGQPDCVSNITTEWTYSWFYKTRLGLNVLFIIIQWLIVGVVAEKLGRLVKDS